MSDFATRLRELREARRITRYRLAQLSGISKQGVTKLERPGSDPKLSTLLKLAGALGIEVVELLPKGTGKKRPGKTS
jgi:transcriptional regulator with XRE-family HTH domain